MSRDLVEGLGMGVCRIVDIDVAEESSRLAATRILQQSAASILAQANQQPRLVLSLLGNI